ncbi:hypothetical protein JCM16303_006885 [Sporobolomyces ruberrimus]
MSASNYATPSTSTSTPGTASESVTSGRFFNSNVHHQFAPPPPPAPSSSLAPPSDATKPKLDPPQRPPLPHATSSTGSYPSRMVFLDERSPNSATEQGGSGGGGATFLSDEETNASDTGSAFDRPPPLQHRESSASAAAKGKSKAVEDEDASAVGAHTTVPKKKQAKSKKQTIGPDGKPVTRERKKKAGRACAACQKAHLTCDDGRPCKRCVKKGCPDECVDGARKKAKYLQEVPDELLERGRNPGGEGTPSFNNGGQLLESPSAAIAKPSQSPIPPAQTLPPESTRSPLPATSSQPIFDFSSTMNATAGPSTSNAPTASTSAFYDTSSFLNFGSTSANSGGVIDHTQFGSEAANLEYAILSSMLNGNGFALDAHTPNLSGGIGASLGNSFDPRFATSQNGRMAGVNGDDMQLGGIRDGTNGNEGTAGGGETAQGGGFDNFGPEKGDTEMFSATGEGNQHSAAAQKAATIGSGVPGLMTAEEALRSVTKPYPYAQSYHFLVKHLKTRFEKNDILRIVRALATFRPSLIALQMPLTEEDETFVERTFQRTLVELHKLISFSGTPTVVWRRTGEICLVGTEFCLLTGWKREELVGTGNVNGVTTSGGGRAGGGKYIFELFDTASVVEYYESFAKHAFESTSTSVTLQCVVLGPDGRPVPCAFCFSVRRDLFSCPFLIIGSFLPILV